VRSILRRVCRRVAGTPSWPTTGRRPKPGAAAAHLPNRRRSRRSWTSTHRGRRPPRKKMAGFAVYNTTSACRESHRGKGRRAVDSRNITAGGSDGQRQDAVLAGHTCQVASEVPFAIVDATTLTEAGRRRRGCREHLPEAAAGPADGVVTAPRTGITTLTRSTRSAAKAERNRRSTRDFSLGRRRAAGAAQILEGNGGQCAAPKGGRSIRTRRLTTAGIPPNHSSLRGRRIATVLPPAHPRSVVGRRFGREGTGVKA